MGQGRHREGGRSECFLPRSKLISIGDDDLVADKKTGSQRQVGIVEFVNREDAEWSVKFLNGFKYKRCSLIVEGPFKLQDVERDLGI